MAHIVTLNTPSREDWLTQLADVVTDPDELLRLLNIDADEKLLAGRSAKKLFALRVPRSFIDRMEKGNPNDPLLRQVITSQDEFVVAPGFSTDPLEEQHSVVPGLLQPGAFAGQRRLRGKLPLLLPSPLPLCRKSGQQA